MHFTPPPPPPVPPAAKRTQHTGVVATTSTAPADKHTMDVHPCYLLVLLMPAVYGGGEVALNLISYENDGGVTEAGECCDRISSWCLSACDPYFHVCLSTMGESVDDIQALGCTTTDAVHNENEIQFGADIEGTANPFIFSFDEWGTRGAGLVVDIWDHDTNSDDFIESVEIGIGIIPAASSEQAQSVPVNYNGIAVKLRAVMRAYCHPGYFTWTCSVFCQANDDEYGHYGCDENGQKVCHPGWVGQNCSTEINECSSVPCQHGAVCQDLINRYICHCDDGYSGTNCETITDICVTEPCINGGECESEGLEYTCACAPGYHGVNCELEVNACDSAPCENGAECVPSGSLFICHCPISYTGSTCEDEVVGKGHISIRLVSYENPDGTAGNGYCCDGYTLCTSQCDPYFHVCLGKSDGAVSFEECPVGRFITGVVEDADVVEFGDTVGATPNPIEFPFQKWDVNGLLVLVDVWDSDGSSSDDFIDFFHQLIHVMPGEASQTYVMEFGTSRLTLAVSVVCDPGWYGVLCSVNCQPEIDKFDCGSDGRKLCKPGWVGPDCAVPGRFHRRRRVKN